MGVVYDAATRTARMSVVKSALDGGSIEICSAGYAAVLATMALPNPCGAVAGDVLTFTAPLTDSSADNAGTAAVARAKDSGGTVRVSGLTVGTAGANVNLNSTTISAGDTVTLTSGALTHNTSGV